MRFRIGTSGFSYAPWRGSFYPADLPGDGMLRYYAERFDAVEINNSFYRMPSPEVLAGWATQVPDAFVFALKTPRYILPNAKLDPARGDPIEAFFSTVGALGARRGPALVMIPPTHKKKDAGLLGAFLARFPRDERLVVELRAETWLADDVFAVLRDRGAALCITDAEDLVVPPVATAPFVYARLRRSKYTRRDLAAWAKRLAGMTDEAMVFFKHEDEGTGPRYASQLRAIVS